LLDCHAATTAMGLCEHLATFTKEAIVLLGQDKITRQELALIETPEATDTFKPIPHHTLVEQLAETLSFRHINVTSDEYVVSPDGMKMFGLLQLDATFLDCRFQSASETLTTKV